MRSVPAGLAKNSRNATGYNVIYLYKAKNEKRNRDLKRKRLILEVGPVCYHITKKELETLTISFKNLQPVVNFNKEAK